MVPKPGRSRVRPGLAEAGDAHLDLPPAADLVANEGPLDLDHVGAEVREEHRTHRRGKEIGDVHNADAFERQRTRLEGVDHVTKLAVGVCA